MSSVFEIETDNSFVEIEDETGEKIGLTIELRPMSSPEVKRKERANRSEFQTALRKGRDTVAMTEKHNADLLATCIVGWEWSENPQVVTPTGKVFKLRPFEYSHEKAVAMMQDADFPFVRRQVDEHLGQASNFYKG